MGGQGGGRKERRMGGVVVSVVLVLVLAPVGKRHRWVVGRVVEGGERPGSHLLLLPSFGLLDG